MMTILIVSEHVMSDPERYTFYTADRENKYLLYPIKKIINKENTIAQGVNLVATMRGIRKCIKKNDVAIVISANSKIGMMVGAVNRLTSSKASHVVWGFNIHALYTGMKLSFAKFSLRDVKNIIVYSSHEKDIYAKMLGINPDKIIMKLFSGPYLEDSRYKKLSMAKNDYVVSAGYSGRDFAFLASVASRLPAVRFVILAYPNALGDTRFGANVSVVHGISETEYCQYIAGARLSFIPLKNHVTANGHIAIVQSMCLKTLVLTNLTEGTSDYILPDDNALLFSEGDVDDTATMILAILANEGKWNGIVNNAYAFAQKNFSVRTDIDVVNRIARVEC